MNAPTLFTTPAPSDLRNAVADLGTVLGVWAHPDDESYLFGGLAGLALDAGNRVACITATRGELGTADPATWPPARLARARTAEMRAAMAALGIHDHRWLAYADGACAAADSEHAADVIGHAISEIGADTVVTFGPDGMTGHPDHIAVSGWATRAVESLPRPPRLLYATTTAEHVEAFAPVVARLDGIDVFGPAGPPITPVHELALAFEPPDGVLDRKLAALRAHASQTDPLVAALGDDAYRAWVAFEAFREHRPSSDSP